MKKYLILLMSALLINLCLPAFAAKLKLSKVCKEGIKACTSLEQGSQTISEALQACITCCTDDTGRIVGKKCFNSCTNECAIKFTGKPVKRTTLD